MQSFKVNSLRIAENQQFARFLASKVRDRLSLLLDLDTVSGSGLKMLPSPISTRPDFVGIVSPWDVSPIADHELEILQGRRMKIERGIPEILLKPVETNQPY